MIIRKTQQPSDYPSNIISNVKTTGTTNTYSCDYINGIVESGSNENGNWVKYADGTMICTHSFNVNAETTTQNNIFWSGWLSSKSYPVPFISTPIIHINLNKGAWSGKENSGTSSATPRFCIFTAGSWSSTSFTVDYIAIGKWK